MKYFYILFACLLVGCQTKEERLAAALDEVERLKELKGKLASLVLAQELLIQDHIDKKDERVLVWSKQRHSLFDAKNELNILKLKRLITEEEKRKRIAELQKRITQLEKTNIEAEEKFKRDWESLEKQEQKMRADLAITIAAYDSISALHTDTVFAMSKIVK